MSDVYHGHISYIGPSSFSAGIISITVTNIYIIYLTCSEDTVSGSLLQMYHLPVFNVVIFQ